MCFVVACVMSWWHGEVAVSHLFGTLDLQFWSGSCAVCVVEICSRGFLISQYNLWLHYLKFEVKFELFRQFSTLVQLL